MGLIFIFEITVISTAGRISQSGAKSLRLEDKIILNILQYRRRPKTTKKERQKQRTANPNVLIRVRKPLVSKSPRMFSKLIIETTLNVIRCIMVSNINRIMLSFRT